MFLVCVLGVLGFSMTRQVHRSVAMLITGADTESCVVTGSQDQQCNWLPTNLTYLLIGLEFYTDRETVTCSFKIRKSS